MFVKVVVVFVVVRKEGGEGGGGDVIRIVVVVVPPLKFLLADRGVGESKKRLRNVDAFVDSRRAPLFGNEMYTATGVTHGSLKKKSSNGAFYTVAFF